MNQSTNPILIRRKEIQIYMGSNREKSNTVIAIQKNEQKEAKITLHFRAQIFFSPTVHYQHNNNIAKK